jgi:hypothetical protein
MRYQGPGRSPWPIIGLIAAVIILALAVYLLFLQ